MPTIKAPRIEWITFAMILSTYVLWVALVFAAPLWLAVPALVPVLVLHSSLSHEVLHGHPLPWQRLNEALVIWNPGLAVPYLRFRDTHLAHHHDAFLTDPYDDPETNFLDPAVWVRMPRWLQALRRFNNTLAGRMLVGPVLGQVAFMVDDWRAIRAGDRAVLTGWLWHVPGVALTLWLVGISPMPFWAYLLAIYVAMAVLKIRTFLEHQAHERCSARTVVIEDRGLLALLFLNNNFHVVHHMHPKVAWYKLPTLYAQKRDHFLRRNDGYRYGNYGQIFARHFWRAKDPVPHPLWRDPEN